MPTLKIKDRITINKKGKVAFQLSELEYEQFYQVLVDAVVYLSGYTWQNRQINLHTADWHAALDVCKSLYDKLDCPAIANYYPERRRFLLRRCDALILWKYIKAADLYKKIDAPAIMVVLDKLHQKLS